MNINYIETAIQHNSREELESIASIINEKLAVMDENNKIKPKEVYYNNPKNKERLEEIMKWMHELQPVDHMAVFIELKKYTKERLDEENQKYEHDFMAMRDKVNQIDEFIKTNLL